MQRRFRSLDITFSIIYLEAGDNEELVLSDNIKLRYFTVVIHYAKELSFNKYTVVGLGLMWNADSLKDAESKIMEYYK